MKKIFTNLRGIALAGLLFLLPIHILFTVLARAWAPLSSIGTKIAKVSGFNSVLGVAGSTVFGVLLLIVSVLTCGLLMRFSFVAALNRAAEGWLSKNIPGYDAYKTLAENKLHLGVKVLPYTAV